MTTYLHTQPGTFIRILVGTMLLVWIFIVALKVKNNGIGALIGLPITLAILACFWSMTVEVTNTHLQHYFSWGFWKKSYPIHNITSIEKGRTHWYNGYGIRYVGTGWLYNVSGHDVLIVTLQSGEEIRLGTDDLEELHTILSDKLDR